MTIILGVVFTGIYFLSQGSSYVLPSYLNRCLPLNAPLVYDSRPQLNITINGSPMTVPANIGVTGTCVRPIHTFASIGTIYVETDVNRTYTLGDFFLVWGYSFGRVYSYFNQTRIFNYVAGNGHNLTMTVSEGLGAPPIPDSRFDKYPFPIDADTSYNPVMISIVYQ